jgi:hypothetical protein
MKKPVRSHFFLRSLPLLLTFQTFFSLPFVAGCGSRLKGAINSVSFPPTGRFQASARPPTPRVEHVQTLIN